MKNRNALVYILSACSFVVFFQTYLFAPILHSLAADFQTSDARVGWLVPAFMLPYGFAALFYGTLSDRWGRLRIILILLALMSFTIVLGAFCRTLDQLLLLRVLCGISSGGIIPISIAVVGDVFAYKDRGHPLGWIYSGMAGGAALGSTVGAYFNPILGWRGELVLIAMVTALLFVLLAPSRKTVPEFHNLEATLPRTFHAYADLLRLPRGRKAYFYILLNLSFQSGVFTWLGWYFGHRYGLGDQGVGLALLGYGVPGMLLGPVIGRWADRVGRARVLPLGLTVSALSALLLAPRSPLWAAALISACLSLGYDLTQPMSGGLVTSLDPRRRGQAICLSACCLFVGFGLGPLIFELFMHADVTHSLILFGVAEGVLALASLWAFRGETVSHALTLN